MSRHLSVAVHVVSFLLLSLMARADTIAVDASVSGTAGAYSYAYEIDNQTSVGLLLFSLTFTGDLGTIESPTGWVTTTGIGGPGETLVEWISTDVPFDVPASGTLDGFAITSDTAPGSVDFSTFDENFTEFDGQTTGPVASTVPEPGSLILLILPVFGFCARRWFRHALLRFKQLPSRHTGPLPYLFIDLRRLFDPCILQPPPQTSCSVRGGKLLLRP